MDDLKNWLSTFGVCDCHREADTETLRNALRALLDQADAWDEDWGRPSEHAGEVREIVAKALDYPDKDKL